MTVRGLFAPVVLALLAAGGLVVVAASRTWASATVRVEGLAPDPVSVTGAEALPLAPALALVVATGALAVLASAGRVRRAVGVLVVLVAVGGLVVTVGGGAAVNEALDDVVRESPAFTGENVPDVVALSGWRVVASAAFAVAALLGVVVAAVGHRWPAMGRRYEAPTSAAQEPQGEQDLWKAMDEGRDPTA